MTHTTNDHLNEGSGGFDWAALVDVIYRDFPVARAILLEHSRAVARLALKINADKDIGLPEADIVCAAMLHDIGIALTHAPAIGCTGSLPYICHGTAGADLLRRHGAPEWCARVAERHTGSGLTADDIAAQNLPLPSDRDLMPQTDLEKLICYADKFFSKNPGKLSDIKSVERVKAEMERHGAESLDRFNRLHEHFGIDGLNR